jgi:hypothetical protein
MPDLRRAGNPVSEVRADGAGVHRGGGSLTDAGEQPVLSVVGDVVRGDEGRGLDVIRRLYAEARTCAGYPLVGEVRSPSPAWSFASSGTGPYARARHALALRRLPLR